MKLSLGANIIFVTDLPRAKEWYEKNLGMKTIEYRPPEFLEMKLGGATFYIETENSKRAEGFRDVKIGGVSSAIIATDNIKTLVEKLRASGVKIVTEPVEQFWGGWNAKVADPDGNIFILDEDASTISTSVSFDDFKKIEIRAGKIISAEKIPESVKLLKLSVDFGEVTPRQVISGIAPYVSSVESILGKTFFFVANLEPRMILGLQSQAMILATGEGESFSLMVPSVDVPPGSLAR